VRHILIVEGGVEECPEAMAAAGVAQFAESLGFNLADTFASHGEMLADYQIDLKQSPVDAML
jgi:hypothetical protein